jgi:hypothetical protein
VNNETSSIINSLTDDQKKSVSEYFVNQHKKQAYVQLVKKAIYGGIVIGTFIASATIAKGVGDWVSNTVFGNKS